MKLFGEGSVTDVMTDVASAFAPGAGTVLNLAEEAASAWFDDDEAPDAPSDAVPGSAPTQDVAGDGGFGGFDALSAFGLGPSGFAPSGQGRGPTGTWTDMLPGGGSTSPQPPVGMTLAGGDPGEQGVIQTLLQTIAGSGLDANMIVQAIQLLIGAAGQVPAVAQLVARAFGFSLVRYPWGNIASSALEWDDLPQWTHRPIRQFRAGAPSPIRCSEAQEVLFWCLVTATSPYALPILAEDGQRVYLYVNGHVAALGRGVGF